MTTREPYFFFMNDTGRNMASQQVSQLLVQLRPFQLATRLLNAKLKIGPPKRCKCNKRITMEVTGWALPPCRPGQAATQQSMAAFSSVAARRGASPCMSSRDGPSWLQGMDPGHGELKSISSNSCKISNIFYVDLPQRVRYESPCPEPVSHIRWTGL